MGSRYWTQGHAERHHGGLLVRVQGFLVRVHGAGEEEARPQVSVQRRAQIGVGSSRASFLSNNPEIRSARRYPYTRSVGALV